MSKIVSSLMEITKRSPRPYKSLVAPAGASGRGIAYIEDTANPGNAILADGSAPFAGFVTRPIVVGGPGLADIVYPNRLELPFSDTADNADSNIISLELGEEVEAEAFDALHVNGYLYSGSGGNAAKTISGATALKTKCSFFNGQFCVAVSGQYAEFMLQELPTPMVAGNLRARFIKIEGAFVP